MKTNLILIGMPASGKSTLGALLAARLGKAFLDTDHVLQEQVGKPLQQILNEEGLPRFLELEEQAVCSIQVEQTVIATGGSVVYSPRAMAHLASLGFCIYLAVPYAAVEARLHNLKTRGVAIAAGTSLRALYDERAPLYEQYADLIFREGKKDVETKQNLEQLLLLLESKKWILP